jgi:hypothetical protein
MIKRLIIIIILIVITVAFLIIFRKWNDLEGGNNVDYVVKASTAITKTNVEIGNYISTIISNPEMIIVKWIKDPSTFIGLPIATINYYINLIKNIKNKDVKGLAKNELNKYMIIFSSFYNSVVYKPIVNKINNLIKTLIKPLNDYDAKELIDLFNDLDNYIKPKNIRINIVDLKIKETLKNTKNKIINFFDKLKNKIENFDVEETEIKIFEEIIDNFDYKMNSKLIKNIKNSKLIKNI